jgi:phage replication O-like protein O
MTRALIPNSTQIPDVILDQWMAALSGAELKVLLYVARRTYGFGKESDNISISQLAEGIKRRDGTSLDHGTGLSRSGVKTACNSLIERGLLVRINNRSGEGGECEESTYRLNLFAASRGVGQKKAYLGQKKAYLGQKEAQVGQKNSGGRPKIGQGVGQKLAPQETDQETDQETAAGEGCPEKDDAAAALVEELVAQGVSRTAATRLAHEKPESCRRCLEYLPHATIKTTKGAWLANAIRDEYGPPPGFEAEKARLARQREAEARTLAKNALQTRGLALREAKAVKLETSYQELRGEAYSAFNAYVESERAKTDRIASHLSPERRQEILAAFDKPERRLELFEAWVNSTPAILAQEGSLPDPNRLDPPEPLERQGQVDRSLFLTAQAS